MNKEAELKKLKQKLHDEEVGAFYSECISPNLSDADREHNHKLAEGIQVIREQIAALENN